MTAALIRLLSNGAGRHFAQCRWCRRSSPTVDGPDDLRALAAARAAGWLVRDSDPTCAGGALVVVCPRCRARD